MILAGCVPLIIFKIDIPPNVKTVIIFVLTYIFGGFLVKKAPGIIDRFKGRINEKTKISNMVKTGLAVPEFRDGGKASIPRPRIPELEPGKKR